MNGDRRKRTQEHARDVDPAEPAEEIDGEMLRVMGEAARRFVTEEPERYEAAKQEALHALGIVVSVMNIMAALAAPQYLATNLRNPPTRAQLTGLLDQYLAFIEQENGADNRLARTAAPTRRMRALLGTWEFGPVAPEPIIMTAREYMAAYGVHEPDGGWDRWAGPTDDFPPANT